MSRSLWVGSSLNTSWSIHERELYRRVDGLKTQFYSLRIYCNVFWSASFQLHPTSLPTNLLSSILKNNSLSPVCAAHELCWVALSCVPIHWSVVDLPGASLWKTLTLPSLEAFQLSRAPQLVLGTGEPLPMLSCRVMWSCAPLPHSEL